MLPRVDSASQNQGSGKSSSWLPATASMKGDDTRSRGLQAEAWDMDAKVPRSPTIQAKWPSPKAKRAPKARISGETERGKPTQLQALKGPEQPLIALDGNMGPNVMAVFETPLLAQANETAFSKPVTRSDSSDSISKILYDSPEDSPCAPPSDLMSNGSGNPFAQHSDLLPPAPQSTFRPPLQSQTSMPLRSGLNRMPSVGESEPLHATLSTELHTHRSLGVGELATGRSAPLPPSWFPVDAAEPPRHSRTLSDGHGILGRSWSAAAANIDPCAEVLVNTFADFSKDMVPAQAQRMPMKRQTSLSSQRSMQSTF